MLEIPLGQAGAAADRLAGRRSLLSRIGAALPQSEVGSAAHGLPVILYHKIGSFRPYAVRRGLYVSVRSFRAQLRALRRAGFAPCDAIPADAATETHPLDIAFDDGFSSALTFGLPALAEQGFRAINFLVAGMLGRSNEWDAPDGELTEPLMDAGQVQVWLDAGHRIGAHSLTHPHLTRLPIAEAREEISASKKSLEDRFGRPITDFAYPFGEFDSTILSLVAEAGFERAWTVNPGFVTAASDPLALPRLTVMINLRKPLNLWRSVFS